MPIKFLIKISAVFLAVNGLLSWWLAKGWLKKVMEFSIKGLDPTSQQPEKTHSLKCFNSIGIMDKHD